MKAKNLPRALQIAAQKLPQVLYLHRYGGGRASAMRSDRRDNLILLLRGILETSCLKFDGAACIVHDGQARPATVNDLVRRTGMARRTVERCLADLRDMGLLSTGRQIRHRGLDGGFVVSSVLRMLTRTFWDAVGCWSLFVEGVKYAAKSRLKLVFPKYRGGKRPKNGGGGGYPAFRLTDQITAISCPYFGDSACAGGYQSASVCSACKASKMAAQRC